MNPYWLYMELLYGARFCWPKVNGFHWGYFTAFFHPVGSMGLVYLPTFLPSNQPFM